MNDGLDWNEPPERELEILDSLNQEIDRVLAGIKPEDAARKVRIDFFGYPLGMDPNGG